jgi:hypothetical protein
MTTPFSFNGTLQLPPDTGLCAAGIPLVMATHFGWKTNVELALQGAGTVDIPLDVLGPAGLKALLIKVDATSDPNVAPIVVRLNGQTPGIEIAPGGFLALASPIPKSGVRAVAITHTTGNVVRVWALG